MHAAASQALGPILQPLAAFVLDSGLSVRELEVLFRTAAVLSVAARQRASGQRVNISGIAATTGIPRAEISQILRAPKRPAATRPLAPSPINRVLAAWHEEPGYQKPSGKPADLRVFGAAPSFEALAKKHGAGLPTRAILDELARAGACTIISTQRIRTNSFSAINSGIGPKTIEAFSAKAAHFFSALSASANSQGHDLLSGISEAVIESSQLPIFRREVVARTADFVSAMRDNLTSNQVWSRAREADAGRVITLAIVYTEGAPICVGDRSKELRRNLRRLSLRNK